MEPPPHPLSPVWLMDGGPLLLALCCDKQQMFSNNVYRPGLHLQMTHLFPVKQAQRGHPSTERWVATAPPIKPAHRGATKNSWQAHLYLKCKK
ncbi:hypothetical protein CesoFtcFv8_005924 [Champsocephalus esox]|uniref:Uncharacterized protein n=1 Tax=Champsocephalus esox TaxID=159716 RepID=A0AAN8CIG5_9TELE|nr:hypothetical protein CesoFtcFv8_005924 [Champsocephalus esox]